MGRSSLVLRKYAPEILTATGVVGVVTASVMASKATLKLEPIVERLDIDKQHLAASRDSGDIDEALYRKNLAKWYVKSGVDIVKLYGPSVTLGAASIAMIVGAHGIMRQRNAALVVAYKGLEQTFTEYRKRVVDEIGEEREQKVYYNLKEETIEGEDGKEKVVTSFKDPNGISIYARWFDESNPSWEPAPGYNLTFVKARQNWFNDKLKTRGHVFLNEVYDALGFPRTQEGAVVGWVLSDKSDNFVDFGIFDPSNEAAREFVNGYTNKVLLDFNVDGVIFNLI